MSWTVRISEYFKQKQIIKPKGKPHSVYSHDESCFILRKLVFSSQKISKFFLGNSNLGNYSKIFSIIVTDENTN